MKAVEKLISDIIGTGTITDLSKKTVDELMDMLEQLEESKSKIDSVFNCLVKMILHKTKDENSSQECSENQ